MKSKMQLGLYQFSQLNQEWLTFTKQLGIEKAVIANPKLPGEGHWEFIDLLRLRTTIEDAGLMVGSIENVPISILMAAYTNSELIAQNLQIFNIFDFLQLVFINFIHISSIFKVKYFC